MLFTLLFYETRLVFPAFFSREQPVFIEKGGVSAENCGFPPKKALFREKSAKN
jgi:hypothetical protein